MADLLKITFYKLIKFMQAEIGIALMPFQYKLAKRYFKFTQKKYEENTQSGLSVSFLGSLKSNLENQGLPPATYEEHLFNFRNSPRFTKIIY